MSAASASAAQVSGRVFNDFNTNGVFDTDENAGAVDVGVSGLTIQAFTGTGTPVGTATSGAGGAYTLNLPDASVRLELAVVRPWWPTRQLNGLRSDVQFVAGSSAQTGVDFGVHRPSEFSVDNPTLFWPAQWAGPPVESNPNANQIAIRGVPFFERRLEGQGVQNWQDLTDRVERATFRQVGTVFGLAINPRTGDIYAGAFYKRMAGLKDRKPGAIFKITPQGDVSLFHELDAGVDQHPTSPDIDNWINCAGADADDPASLTRCDFSWDSVGKLGLGSVEIGPGQRNLYTVNLNDRSLYRLPLGESRSRRRARQAAAPTPIPDPACVGGVWRPFAAGFNRSDDHLYVGGVCSANTPPESGQPARRRLSRRPPVVVCAGVRQGP